MTPRCIIVSNGYINPKPLKELIPYLDAANIDIKSIEPEFYKKYCLAKLEPVLETLKTLAKSRVHLEITNLLLEGKNSSEEQIKKLCKWIKDNLGSDISIHFTAAHPCYKMLDIIPTKIETVMKAKKIAEDIGLSKVEIGNI